MESSDLNPSAHDDARLEALLRRPTPVLPDAGFSVRVVAALPAASQQYATWRRIAVCIAGAAVGCGFAFWQPVALPALRTEAGPFISSLLSTAAPLVNPMSGAALLVTAFSLLFAFKAELRDKLLL